MTISYGPWPTEPLLLLFGFVPQHNPHDSLVLFSNLQHMADCWLEMLSDSSTSSSSSGSGAADKSNAMVSAAVSAALSSMVADSAFAELLQEEISLHDDAAVDGVQQQQQASGPPGFRDLALSAGSVSDVRLSAGIQVLQGAVGAAVQQWCSQADSSQQSQQEQHMGQLIRELKGGVPAVVRYRLQQLARELGASAAAAAAEGNSSNSSGKDEQTEAVDDFISYSTSAEHRSLIDAYCSSKAELAKQLLAKM